MRKKSCGFNSGRLVSPGSNRDKNPLRGDPGKVTTLDWTGLECPVQCPMFSGLSGHPVNIFTGQCVQWITVNVTVQFMTALLNPVKIESHVSTIKSHMFNLSVNES